MKAIMLLCKDKEFDDFWTALNKYMEEEEDSKMIMFDILGIDKIKAFEGMFGLPESYFETLHKNADEMWFNDYQTSSAIIMWRLVKAVLHE